jgi:hypothetical protein
MLDFEPAVDRLQCSICFVTLKDDTILSITDVPAFGQTNKQSAAEHTSERVVCRTYAQGLRLNKSSQPIRRFWEIFRLLQN